MPWRHQRSQRLAHLEDSGQLALGLRVESEADVSPAFAYRRYDVVAAVDRYVEGNARVAPAETRDSARQQMLHQRFDRMDAHRTPAQPFQCVKLGAHSLDLAHARIGVAQEDLAR